MNSPPAVVVSLLKGGIFSQGFVVQHIHTWSFRKLHCKGFTGRWRITVVTVMITGYYCNILVNWWSIVINSSLIVTNSLLIVFHLWLMIQILSQRLDHNDYHHDSHHDCHIIGRTYLGQFPDPKYGCSVWFFQVGAQKMTVVSQWW